MAKRFRGLTYEQHLEAAQLINVAKNALNMLWALVLENYGASSAENKTLEKNKTLNPIIRNLERRLEDAFHREGHIGKEHPYYKN